MARNHIKKLIAVAVMAIAVICVSVASAATLSSPFRIVTSPSPGRAHLVASSAISPTDVWAVGSDGNTREGLAEHWNGSAWTVVAAPTSSQGGGDLVSVSALSSTNVWAVGNVAGHAGSMAVEHWNGTAWSVVPSPVPSQFSSFTSVHAISANNVYAVGVGGEGGNPGFVEHWDGAKWSIISTALSGLSQPKSVSASSAGDVWVVGEQEPTNQGIYTGFAEHFNGTMWRRTVGFPGGQDTVAVDDISPTNAWTAGGGSGAPSANANLFHWDGTSWKVASSPGAAGSKATAIAGRSANDIWAVGSTSAANGNQQTFAERFNGTTWSVVPTPSPKPAPNPYSTASFTSLNAVSITTDGHVYAVGDIADNFTDKTLILENDLG